MSHLSDSNRQHRLLQNLQRRAELLCFVRQFFCKHGYWEVETPLLTTDSCIDRWLDPLEVQVSGRACYLQTSPEFAMKRLLCADASSIFQICKAFRAGEIGEHHNPEFTMLEWYRLHTPLVDQITFVEQLVTACLKFASERNWLDASHCSPQFRTLTYEEAFQASLNLSPHDASVSTLLSCAIAAGYQNSSGGQPDRDDLLNYLLVTVVEPQLESMEAVSLTDYPASQAALATIRDEKQPVADRFEMYFRGHEICNGYQELTDPEELRERMVLQNKKRIKDGKPSLPIDSKLLHEMKHQGLPECSGVALGLDRLVMICLDCSSLKDVLAYPFNDV